MCVSHCKIILSICSGAGSVGPAQNAFHWHVPFPSRLRNHREWRGFGGGLAISTEIVSEAEIQELSSLFEAVLAGVSRIAG